MILISLLIKFIARIIQGIGLIYRPRKQIKGVKTILINKADRIGDAIVALPFLLELKRHFDVSILTTGRNDFVFKDFFKTEIVLEKPRYIYDELKAILKSMLIAFQKQSADLPIYDVYLDLNGIREIDFLIKLKKENKCKYYIGLNSGPFNIFLDYAYYTNSMLFAKQQILETFREVVKESLQIDIEIPDYLDLTSKMQKPEGVALKKPYILMNIAGASNFRGPSVRFYAEIVKKVADDSLHFIIMDELNQPNLENFQHFLNGAGDNIIFLNKNLSLWELLYVASQSILYIGADSGVTNFLNIPTNAVILFAGGPVWSWFPYSKNPYVRKKTADVIIAQTRTCRGLIKKVVYCPIWCRPCFDIGCKTTACIQKLEQSKDIIINEIKEIINASG